MTCIYLYGEREPPLRKPYVYLLIIYCLFQKLKNDLIITIISFATCFVQVASYLEIDHLNNYRIK